LHQPQARGAVRGTKSRALTAGWTRLDTTRREQGPRYARRARRRASVPLRDAREGAGAREVVALAERDAEASQRLELVLRLDALGDHLRGRGDGEAEDRAEEVLLDAVALDVLREVVVELQELGLDLREGREVRVARAEVVDRDAEALVAELLD